MSHCAEPTATRCHVDRGSRCPCKAAVVEAEGAEKMPATDAEVRARVASWGVHGHDCSLHTCWRETR